MTHHGGLKCSFYDSKVPFKVRSRLSLLSEEQAMNPFLRQGTSSIFRGMLSLDGRGYYALAGFGCE